MILFPAGVRTTGLNLSLNVGVAVCGGITPLVVTALAERLRPAALAAAVVFLTFSAVSLTAVVPLARLAPQTTIRARIGDLTSCL
jgi:hypothetical protein